MISYCKVLYYKKIISRIIMKNVATQVKYKICGNVKYDYFL